MSLYMLAATAFSAAFLFLLYSGDPKRRRSARLAGKGQSSAQRRLLAAAACLPGIVYAVRGDASAFLIWLGGSAVIGWIYTVVLSARCRSRS